MAEVCRIGEADREEGGKEGWKESGLKVMRLASSHFLSFLTCLHPVYICTTDRHFAFFC